MLTAFFSCSALFASAQTQVGLRAGVNATTVTGDAVRESLETGFGYNIGFFYKIKLAGIKLQPELMVSGRSFTFSQNMGQPGDLAVAEKKVKATYLDVPLLLLVELSDNVNLLFGPQFSIRVGGTQTVTGDQAGDAYELKWYDTGLSAGLNYVFPGGIDLTARGIYGVSDIFEKTNLNHPGDSMPDIRSLQLQFTVGLPISTSNPDEVDRSSYKTIY